MVFSFFLFLVLVFVIVHASSVSSIATCVEEIDGLVPDAQKKPFIVKFFKDPKNLEILNEAVKNDVPRVQNIFIEIWNCCLVGSWIKCPETTIFGAHEAALYSHIICSPNKFTLEDAVRDLAAYLKTYDDLYKKGYIFGGKPIGEMVDTMIGSLKELKPENWDKEFFAKLQKAFKNEDYRTEAEKVDDSGNKNDGENDENKGDVKKDGNNGNSGGNGNNGSGHNLLYYVLAIFLILLVVGAVVFFILRHKNQASTVV
jgi:hypothetical protein